MRLVFNGHPGACPGWLRTVRADYLIDTPAIERRFASVMTQVFVKYSAKAGKRWLTKNRVSVLSGIHAVALMMMVKFPPSGVRFVYAAPCGVLCRYWGISLP